MVAHYVGEVWQTPTDPGTPRRHPVLGHVTYQVTDHPLDASAAFAHARTVGLPALHRLGFASRSRVLRDAARQLAEHQAEFTDLGEQLGVRTADAERDIRTGLGTLRHLAGAGARQFAHDTHTDGRLLVEDTEATQSRTLAATPPGVAVHIGGFGDPLADTLDAVARAFLAGTPCILRPSRRTALLVAHVVRRITECAEIPPGSLQLVSGPADLLSGLGPHDLLTFTGSAATARRLRTRIAHHRLPPHCEFTAGPLDCAVLGEDATPGGPAFLTYVAALVAAMTARNGQTRRAVRRAFVPAHLLDAVAQAVHAELRTTEPPALGPLVDRAHRRRVLDALARLRTATRTVHGTSGEVGAWDRAYGPGAYLPPVLLAADSAATPEPHAVEAFGPVATLIPYRAPADLADALASGGGGLRSWAVTDDPDHARSIAHHLAPTHERIDFVTAGTDSPEPPRDLRQVRDRLTTTTVVATPDRLTAVTGRWTPGAPQRAPGRHPLRIPLSDLRPGDAVTAGPRVVTRADIAAFADLTGDRYYLHTDDEAAAQHPLFRGIVAHGHLVAALATGMLVPPEPGPVLANLGIDNLRFLAPVRPGDPLTATMTAVRITPRTGPGRGEVRWHIGVTGGDGRPVVHYDLTTLTADKDTTDARCHDPRPL